MKSKNAELELSVVVISKNEEATISRCIESVLEEIVDWKSEVILVDSASTDQTIEIALKYPIRIIQFMKGGLLSPSAGRYVGTIHSKGKYILFLDGDMILMRGWTKKVREYVEDGKIGGIDGDLFNVFPGEELNYSHKCEQSLGKVSCLGGAGMYRRDALEKSGTFNPFVRGEEERELGYRLNSHGFELLSTDIPMAYHLVKKRNVYEIGEKARYFAGIGQIFRKYFFKRISWDLVKSHARLFVEQAILLVLFVGFLLPIFLMLLVPLFIAVSLIFLLGLLLIKAKGKEKVYLFFRFRILALSNIIKGIILGIQDSKEYEQKIQFIKG
jgi:glycosyltransferase involved in cell wall biosynthesis